MEPFWAEPVKNPVCTPTMQLQAQNEFCYIQARSTDDRAQSDFNDPALNVNQMMSLSLVAEMNPKWHR